MISEMTDEQIEAETKARIHRFCCAIRAWDGITISQAQAIFGEFADADDVIPYMLVKKTLMKSGGKYEYTFDGLIAFYHELLPQAQAEHGENVTDLQLAAFVLKESLRVAGKKP